MGSYFIHASYDLPDNLYASNTRPGVIGCNACFFLFFLVVVAFPNLPPPPANVELFSFSFSISFVTLYARDNIHREQIMYHYVT